MGDGDERAYVVWVRVDVCACGDVCVKRESAGVREYECMWGEVLVCVNADVGCVTMWCVGMSMLSVRLWVSVLCVCRCPFGV